MTDTPTEQPDDKDLQDHTFGLHAEERRQQAEDGATDGGDDRPTEEHAGGKA